MGVRDDFKNFISKYKKDEMLAILSQNSMMNIFGNEYMRVGTIETKINRVLTNYNWRRVNDIFKVFKKNGINYIVFKGIVISQLLYGDPYKRSVGDVDFFVFEDHFGSAKEILKEFGFSVMKIDGEKNPHHIVYTDGRCVIELHKNIISPPIGINESYIRQHTAIHNISGNEIITFDVTATILHLIYHLYMDTWLTDVNLYSFLKDREFPQAKRFLYRAYEIALFAEKYSSEIIWENVLNDIKMQKLRVCFKKMIKDILDIFPNAFPDNFTELIFHLDYVDDDRDQLYKHLIEQNNNRDTDGLLCNYINEKWDERHEINICNEFGEPISLAKKTTNQVRGNLKCDIKMDKIKDDLVVTFKVSTRDFYISGLDEFHTLSSDGVHLLLCSTNVYSYNSIFLFPKENNGSYKVIACDVLRKPYAILDDSTIKADFTKTEDGYVLTAILSNKFLSENHLDPYFYMNVIIPDCNPETQTRRDQLMLTRDDSQWYNPMFFAKIYMNKSLTDKKAMSLNSAQKSKTP